MVNNTTRPLIEGAMLTAIAVVMAVMGTALPVLFFLLYILPVPIAVNIFRHGWRWGVISILALCLIVGSIFGVYGASVVMTTTILISPALGIGFRRFSPAKNLIIAMIAAIASVAAAFGAAFLIMGVSINDFQTTLTTATQTSINLYKSMGMDDASIQSQTDQMKSIMEIIMLSLPAIMALSAIISALLNFLLTHYMLKRLGERDLPGLPPFTEWRMPIIFLFLFGFSLVGMYWGSTRSIDMLYNISLNGYYFAAMFCCVQGLSLLYCVMQHFKLPVFPKIMIMVLVIVSYPFMEILVYAGLFDMIFDYRTRISKRNSN